MAARLGRTLLGHFSTTSSKLLNRRVVKFNNQLRYYRHQTENNVVCSNNADFVVPDCLLGEFIWKTMDDYPDTTAVVCGVTGQGYSYSRLYRLSVAFAASLRNKLKLQDGDCIALMVPNSPEFVLAMLGGIQAGCVISTMNPAYNAEEISRQLMDSKAKLVVTVNGCYPEVKKALQLAKSSTPIMIADCNHGVPLPDGAIRFAEFAENLTEDISCLKTVRRKMDDVVFLPYSSGTTGLPKGVQLTHRNIVANCLQQDIAGIELIESIGDQHVIMAVLPLFHIYGLVSTCVSKLRRGSKMVTLPRFTPDTYLNAQEKYRANVLFVVPAIVTFLSSHPKVQKCHTDPVRVIMSGAAPLAATDVYRFNEKAQNPKIEFMQGYGLTESSPVVCMQEKGNTNYASVGTLIPKTHAKIVDIKNERNTLEANQSGELWIRGPQIMKGYYNNPEADKEVFRSGGWMRTGDIGYYDENEQFYITDRLKELIKVKGFQVAPAELEGILRSHPEVLEAAVIGVPHDQQGEIPRAFVVKRKDTSPSAEDIMEFLASKVANYKQLGELTFVESIPKNPTGKIMRRELKEKYTK